MTVYKVGKRLAPSISPHRGFTSLFAPTLSGFTCFYTPNQWKQSDMAPFFVFHQLEDALAFYQVYLECFHVYQLAIYECHTTRLMHTPPSFLPPTRAWPLWDEFWCRWRDGTLGTPDEWVDGTKQGQVLKLPQGTVLCSDLLPMRLVEKRDDLNHLP